MLGKVCVVTNGAKGVGRCVIEEFAKRGCKIAFMDLDMDSGRRLKDYIRSSYGVDIFFFHGDICNEEDLEIFSAFIIEQYGKIDYLINNACICMHNIINRKQLNELSLILRVGVVAPYMLLKLFLNHFNDGASIINVTSNPKDNGSLSEIYDAMHKMIVSITKALAIEAKGCLRVNCVSPMGLYESEEEPELIGDRFDVSRAVLFLCEKKADFINGQDIRVDGSMAKLYMCHGEDGWSFRKMKK